MTTIAAGRELDALVAEKVLGEEYDTYMGEDENGEPALRFGVKQVGTPEHPLYRFGGPPHYSTDIVAAFSVLAKLKATPHGVRSELTDRSFIGYTYGYTTADDPEGREHVDGWTCELRDCYAPWGLVQRGAPTLPEAICRAALALVVGAG